VKRIVRVSLETVKIVNSLPPLNERSPSWLIAIISDNGI
jgi:hypothetical protein